MITRGLILYLFFAYSAARAQYIPQLGQAYQFAPVYNPAFSGIESFSDVKVAYRNQWSGFGKFSPQFFNIAWNTRTKHPVDLKYNSMRISNPNYVDPLRLPRRKRIIHGLGVHVFHSEAGLMNTFGGGANFSIHYPVRRKWKLALGGGVLLEGKKIDLQELTFHEQDPFYESLKGQPNTQLDLSLRAGSVLYSPHFYLGFSWLSALRQTLAPSDIAFDRSNAQAVVMTGFLFPAGPQFDLQTSTVFYFLTANRQEADVAIKGVIQDRVMLGAGYRTIQAGLVYLGFDITPAMNLTYSWEVPFGGFKRFSDSSHEVVIGFRMNNVKKVSGYLW